MPDIKTALVNALNEWDKQEEKTQASVVEPKKLSASEATFNLVKENPGIAKKNAVAVLEIKGYKTTSTQSLLSALVREGQMRITGDKRLYVLTTNYMPIKGKAYGKTTKKKAQNLSASPLAALIPQEPPVRSAPAPAPKPVPKPAPEPWCVHKLIDSLSVRQAVELSRELTILFIGRIP